VILLLVAASNVYSAAFDCLWLSLGIVALRLISLVSALAAVRGWIGRHAYFTIICCTNVSQLFRYTLVMQQCIVGHRIGSYQECTVLPSEFVGVMDPGFVGIQVDLAYTLSPLFFTALGVNFSWTMCSLMAIPFARIFVLSYVSGFSRSACVKEVVLFSLLLYVGFRVWDSEKSLKDGFLQSKHIEQSSENVSRVFQDVSLPIFRIDKHGHFLFWNKVVAPPVIQLQCELFYLSRPLH
jgi:hypothetical protein